MTKSSMAGRLGYSCRQKLDQVWSRGRSAELSRVR